MRTYVLERRFKPGEVAQESGVYEALHARHRPNHQVVVLAGMTFPQCRKCGDRVRFHVVAAANNWGLLAREHPPALLVVDDEPEICIQLKRELEREGYRVSAAASYAEAKDLLDREKYDALISELDLEADQVGLELARFAQTMRSAPVVILSTGNPTVQSLRSILGSRIQYLVTKPIDVGELRRALARLIMRRAVTYRAHSEIELHP